MSAEEKTAFGGDWELSEDFYKENGEKRELSLEDFMDDDSTDLNAESGLDSDAAEGKALEQTAERVKQVIAMSSQGKNAAEIATELGVTEQDVKDIMVCVQAFPEDNPMAVARLIVMG